MRTRLRRHLLVSAATVLGTTIAAAGAYALATAVAPAPLRLAAEVAAVFVPLAVGFAIGGSSAHLNLRCPACSERLRWLARYRYADTPFDDCPKCGAHLFDPPRRHAVLWLTLALVGAGILTVLAAALLDAQSR